MADEMTNGVDPTARHYLDAVQAQLGERVTNLGRRQTDLEAEMRSGFRQIEQSISGLSTTLSERNRPQYQALGFGLSVILAVGALAYWPIREAVSNTRDQLQALAMTTVSRNEIDWRAARGAEDRVRMETAVSDIRGNLVPRTEFEAFKIDIQRQLDRRTP